ncbi:MAG: guanylate kinase [Flavobacteriales bacterium]
MNQGKLIIFSAPSGSGKTTIVRHLLQHNSSLSFSISCTTREKRKHEINGKDYYFISLSDFEKKIQQNEFIEYEEVYKDNYYGTLKSEVERIWKEGKHVVFDMDVVGGLNIKKQFGNQALAIFIRPPSVEELQRRLENRSTETPEKMAMRIAKAEQEMALAQKFDVILINDCLEKAQKEAQKIINNFIL